MSTPNTTTQSDDTSVYKSALEDSSFSTINNSGDDQYRFDDDDKEIIGISSDDEDASTLAETSSYRTAREKNTTLTDASTLRNSSDDNTYRNIGATDETSIDISDLTETEPFKIYNSIEEFDRNLPETVTLLTMPNGSKVYLVGTAHFSEQSQNDVSLVIRNVQPDVVLVELCPARIHILKHDEKTLLEEARDINATKIRNIIKTNGALNGIFYILLLNMSAKLTKELGMAPGGEFRRALAEAKLIPNCLFHLGDRPINITLQRALHGLSIFQSMKLLWRLITSNETISKEEVEQCKQRDLLEELMLEMAVEYPAFGDVFVKERDLYLCNSLQTAAQPTMPPGRKPLNIVGVVGIGHTAGIVKHWGNVDQTKIPEILVIPPPSLSSRIVKKTIKYGTVVLIGYGLFKLIKPRLPLRV